MNQPPPDVCGFVPLPCPMDPRWLDVKDAPAPDVEIRGAPISVAVNEWVNHHLDYELDSDDEWTEPVATLERGYGDCEDFSLLKRALLLPHIPTEEMFMLIADDIITRQRHAMLLVNDGEWRMLDNRSDMVWPVAKMQDYLPIIALGEDAWTFGKNVVQRGLAP